MTNSTVSFKISTEDSIIGYSVINLSDKEEFKKKSVEYNNLKIEEVTAVPTSFSLSNESTESDKLQSSKFIKFDSHMEDHLIPTERPKNRHERRKDIKLARKKGKK